MLSWLRVMFAEISSNLSWTLLKATMRSSFIVVMLAELDAMPAKFVLTEVSRAVN